MKKWKTALAEGISLAYGALRRRRSGCRVLMYHAVGSAVPDDVRRLYSIAPERFGDHMRWLAEFSQEEAVVDLSEGVSAGSGIAITFDDGFQDVLTVAAPILAERGFPFTVFVTAGFARAGSSLYMSPAGLRELACVPGVTIGAHGDSHRRLTECTAVELSAELTRSRAWLEDVIGGPVTSMSYPHGAVNGRVRSAVFSAGYDLAASSRFDVQRLGDDRLSVARTDVWAQDDRERLSAKVTGAWDWMRWLT